MPGRITNQFSILACLTLISAFAIISCQSSKNPIGGGGAIGANDPAGWFWQNPLPTAAPLYGVMFSDAESGTVVGNMAHILRTTDGGGT